MPALFAYLIALSLLIGSGYAGLVWLTAPPGSNQASRSGSSHQHTARTFSNENTGAAQDSANSGKESPRSPVKADSSGDSEASNGLVESKSTGANRTATAEQSGEQKKLSKGACAPIGMTARGDFVFPLQCRELVDLPRDTAPSVDRSHQTQRSDPTEQPPSIHGRSVAATMERPSSSHPVAVGGKQLASPKYEPATGDRAGRSGVSIRSVRPSGGKLGSSPKQEQPSPTSSSKTLVSQSDEWFNPLGLH